MTDTATNDTGGTPLDAALAYARHGWRVLPIRPGKKHPPMDSWQHAATTDEQIIRNWYRGLYVGHGVGIATGAASGVFVLDVDVSGDKRGDETLADLEREHGALPDTVRAITGTGGLHIYFGVPTGADIRNNAGTRLGPGLDIRGEGGQVVAAPTLHPNGKPYRWEYGYAPDEISVAMPPAWLVELLTLADQPERQTPPKATNTTAPGTRVDTTADSIAAHIANTHEWHDLLYADGWQQARSTKAGETAWTRPGKEVRDGVSAVLHEPDGPLVVFSTDPGLGALHAAGNPTKDGTGWSLGLFGYIAATRHNGDRSACARAYRLDLNAQQAQAITADRGAIAHAVLTGEVAQDDGPGDWDAIDLEPIASAIRNGTRVRTMPDVLPVKDGLPLLYSGRINQLFGESGGGKTWVGLTAVYATICAGHRATIIDYEDAPDGIAERLVTLGATDEQIALVDYRNPSSGLSVGVSDGMNIHPDTRLILLDSTGEAMAAGGTDGNEDKATAEWFRTVKQVGRLAPGAAILAIDHVPKSTDNVHSYAIGSQRKRAAVTGAAYRVDTIKEPARDKPGVLKLVVAKDRLGNRAKGTTACVIDVLPDGDWLTLDLHLSEAQAAEAKGEKFRPTVLMQRISEWLELFPDASQSTIEQRVNGKATGLRSALRCLVEDGYVVATEHRRGTTYKVDRPYREGMESLMPAPVAAPSAPVDNDDFDLF